MRILCPICKTRIDDAPADFKFRPFCSARCKQLDLANWLDEKYVLSRPVDPDEMDDLS